MLEKERRYASLLEAKNRAAIGAGFDVERPIHEWDASEVSRYARWARSRSNDLPFVREVELVYRDSPAKRQRISSSRDVVKLAESLLLHKRPTERFVVLLLDAKNRVNGWTLAGKGGVSSCPVDPGEVFRAAIRSGSSGVILLHNHPSGVPTPSAEDIAITEKLCKAGRLLGVPVLDHVIVAEEDHFSFLDSQVLPC